MYKFFSKKTKRIICFILTLAIIIPGLCFYNELGLKKGDTAIAAEFDINNVRIYLTTMASLKSVSFTVKGNYSIKSITDQRYSFRNGVKLREAEYTLKIVNNEIVISSPEGEFPLGNSITLYSHDATRESYLTMPNKSYGICNYIGNMNIIVQDGYFRFVNELSIEDYLCGVVPYEMSNAQEVESLKVQAVCARSVAYTSALNSQGSFYDLVDTTANQTYKGYNSLYNKCIAAVDQTAYQIIAYNGACINAYYSASNGGLTETTSNVWFAQLPYYTIKPDPYDKTYLNRRFVLSKNSVIGENSKKIREAVKNDVINMGYDYNTLDVIAINHVIPVYNSEPSYIPEKERRVFSTKFQVTLKAVKTGTGAYQTFSHTFELQKDKGRLFLLYMTPDNKYGTLTSSRYYIEETENEIIAVCSGKGHAIGMSQNGVYARVLAGQTYREIIDFYYTGVEIKHLQYKSRIFEQIPTGEYTDTQANKLTLLPEQKVGWTVAKAPVYENAGAIYNIFDNIENETQVVILGETPNWYYVTVGNGAVNGYVMKKYISVPEPSDPEEVFDTVMKVGKVTTDVWARTTPEYVNEVRVSLLKMGEEVAVLSETGKFYEIFHNNARVFASKENIRITDEPIVPQKISTVKSYKASIYDEPDVTSRKLGYLAENSEIYIVDVNGDFASFVYNGKSAYIKTDRIVIEEGLYAYGPVRYISPVDINIKITADAQFFEAADTQSNVMGSLLAGDILRVTGIENGMYGFMFGDKNVFVPTENAVVYSENIEHKFAIALQDKLIYSSADLTEAVGFVKMNKSIEVIKTQGDTVVVLYNGAICYTDKNNLIINTKKIIVAGVEQRLFFCG